MTLNLPSFVISYCFADCTGTAITMTAGQHRGKLEIQVRWASVKPADNCMPVVLRFDESPSCLECDVGERCSQGVLRTGDGVPPAAGRQRGPLRLSPRATFF